MSETSRNSDSPGARETELAYTLVPQLRCHHLDPRRRGLPCGARAEWMAESTANGAGGYYCTQHAPIAVVPIPADAIFRRVRLTVEVTLGGASWDRTAAQTEALARLERVVQAVGGFLDVKQVTSDVGRAGPLAVHRPRFGNPGKG